MIQWDSGILEEVIANTRVVGRYDGQGRRQQPTENKGVRFSFRSWDGSLSTLLTICEGECTHHQRSSLLNCPNYGS